MNTVKVVKKQRNALSVYQETDIDVSDGKCICVTIKDVGMSIWKLYNDVELVVVENVGVDPSQPLKG